MIPAEDIVCVEFMFSPSLWHFYSGFLTYPKYMHIKWTSTSALSSSVWVKVCVYVPCDGRDPIKDWWFPPCASSAKINSNHQQPLTEINGLEIIILLVFLRCMYYSHIFQRLILEVF